MNLRKYRFIYLFIIMFFTGLSSSLFSAEISSIKFEQQGSYKFPEKMLFFNMKEKEGETFDEKVLNGDIKRLYGTGYFADVVAETTQHPDGRVDILIKLKPKARVKSIIFKGNKKFTSEDLMKQVTIIPETPLSDKELRESARKLRQFYSGKGYNQAKVYPEVKKDGEGYVNIIFDIDEKLRHKINDVFFEGNTVFSNWTLRHSIANRHSYLSWVLDTGLLNKAELKNDKLRLRELYWNKGYLDFKIEDVIIKEDPEDPEYVNLTFKLFEGKPYKVAKIVITGNKKFPDPDLMPFVDGQIGQVYDNRREVNDKERIADLYHPYGYADFQCRVVRIPDYKTHTVELEYHIKEGEMYTVNDVIITGNKVTKDYVIRRELAIQPGDPVDENRIEASKARLMGMGYFENVETVTANAGAPGKKNVDFKVKEKRTAHFKVGAGFSDVDSLVGMIEINQTNFDLFDPGNYFQGGGQRLRLQGFFGVDRYDFNFDFTEPWLFNKAIRFDLNGFINNVAYKHWDERRIGGRTSVTKRIFDDFTSVMVGYTFQQVKVHNVDKDSSQEIQDFAGTQYVSKISLNLSRDTRDSLTEPSSGYLLNALGEVSPKILGSSRNFYRLEAKASQYFSMFDKMLIFHLGGKIGAVSSFNRNKQVPVYERYFLGGGDSLRGFPYRRVSPVDNQDENVGGGSMLLLTAEMTHPIWEFIRGAVFVDAGNVWDLAYTFRFNKMNVGVGYGLRIKVPYLNAPVKLDLAYPILNNQPGLSKKFRFHFNMGFVW